MDSKVEPDTKWERKSGSLGSLGVLVALGPSLVVSFKRWIEVRKEDPLDPLPTEETARLGAAVVRRVLAVGALGILVALIPTMLLVWQNLLLQRQIEQTREQIQTQRDEDYTTRKFALIREIKEDPSAIFFLIELTAQREGRINLRGVNLSGANLARKDLTNADLTNADLSHAILSRTLLAGADLSNADLRNADLGGAILQGANLGGANLSVVERLLQDQLDSANCDSSTILPNSLTCPNHGTTVSQETESR